MGVVIPKVVKEVSIAGLRWHVVEVDPEDYEYWCDVLPPEYIVVRRGAGDEELNKIIRELEVPESVRRIVERLPNEFIEWLKKTKMTPELIDELIAEGACDDCDDS